MNETIHNILAEINANNSTTHKLSVLEKYANNEQLKKLLKMTYDNVDFTYGITMKNVTYIPEKEYDEDYTLDKALDGLKNMFATRKVTGNNAIKTLKSMLETLSLDDAQLIEKVLDRDLKLNIGKTQINKIWKGLCVKPVYNRCDIYTDKTSKNIEFPAIVQLKADGTYREFLVQNGEVVSKSRSGESYEYPILFEGLSKFPDGYYFGELTVVGITDRAEGNGLINSDNPPHERIIFDMWDYVTVEEYGIASLKDRKNPCKTKYLERWTALNHIEFVNPHKNIRVIPSYQVGDIKEALACTSEWMTAGNEGAILKDMGMVFKDGTNKQQLKLKLEIDIEVRCTGFTDGKKGTKRESTFGAITFENDEGTIKGQTSGFTDAQLEDYNNRRDELIGKIMTVQFNDLTKADGHDYHALSHPRFIEFRNDKDDTDTLEKAFELRAMAMRLGE